MRKSDNTKIFSPHGKSFPISNFYFILFYAHFTLPQRHMKISVIKYFFTITSLKLLLEVMYMEFIQKSDTDNLNYWQSGFFNFLPRNCAVISRHDLMFICIFSGGKNRLPALSEGGRRWSGRLGAVSSAAPAPGW